MLGEMPEEERNFYIRYCYEQKKRCYCQTTLADILLMSSEKISLSDKTLQLFRNCGLTVEQRAAKRVFDVVFSALVLVLLFMAVSDSCLIRKDCSRCPDSD